MGIAVIMIFPALMLLSIVKLLSLVPAASFESEEEYGR